MEVRGGEGGARVAEAEVEDCVGVGDAEAVGEVRVWGCVGGGGKGEEGGRIG